MTMYGNNFLSNTPSYDGDTYLLVDLHQGELFSLYGDRFENKVKINWPNQFSDENTDFDICVLGGSANGILCLSLFDLHVQTIILWNPTTEKFKAIPTTTIESFLLPIANSF